MFQNVPERERAVPCCVLCYNIQKLTFTDLCMQTDIGGKKVRVGGIAKGSGMIHPNMAKLLSVVTTDAKVDPGLWHDVLLHGVQKSFNQVCFASHL